MAKLQELGEFVRSASSTIEAPVVRKLTDALQGPGGNAGEVRCEAGCAPQGCPRQARGSDPGCRTSRCAEARRTGPQAGRRGGSGRRSARPGDSGRLRPASRSEGSGRPEARSGGARGDRVLRASGGSGRSGAHRASRRGSRPPSGAAASGGPGRPGRCPSRRPAPGRRHSRCPGPAPRWRGPASAGRPSGGSPPGQQPVHLWWLHRHGAPAGAPSGRRARPGAPGAGGGQGAPRPQGGPGGAPRPQGQGAGRPTPGGMPRPQGGAPVRVVLPVVTVRTRA